MSEVTSCLTEKVLIFWLRGAPYSWKMVHTSSPEIFESRWYTRVIKYTPVFDVHVRLDVCSESASPGKQDIPGGN